MSTKAFSILITIVCFTGVVNADLVGVAFSFPNSPGDDIPNNWTTLAFDGSYLNLTSESGATTSIGATIFGYDNLNGTEPDSNTVPVHTTSLADLDTYAQPNSDEDAFKFTGLDPTQSYRVWAIGLRKLLSYQNDWKITGAITTEFEQKGNADSASNELTFNGHVGASSSALNNYAIIMAPDSAGEISFDLQRNGLGARVAGFAIQAVPEPSSFLFLSLIGITAAAGRWSARTKRQLMLD